MSGASEQLKQFAARANYLYQTCPVHHLAARKAPEIIDEVRASNGHPALTLRERELAIQAALTAVTLYSEYHQPRPESRWN